MSTSTGLSLVKRKLSNRGFLSYFITGDRDYSRPQLQQIFQLHSPALVCYRRLTPQPVEKVALFLEEIARLGGVPILHYRNWHDSLREVAAGVHLPASQLQLAPHFREKGLLVIGSTHSFEEVELGRGCDYITFSPIFDSKGRKGLGVEILERVRQLHPAPLGLGGVVGPREVELLRRSPAVGFASIRYFHRGIPGLDPSPSGESKPKPG